MSKDYYNVLGVDKKASSDDIKSAFRKLAHKYHPDKGGKDENKFKEITEAYSILSNDKKRKEYDTYGQAFAGGAGPSHGQAGQAGAGFGQNGFGGFDFSGFTNGGGFQGFQQGFGGQGEVEFDLDDIFSNVFPGGRGGGRAQTPRGRDISIDLEISFKEAIFGTMRSVLLAKVSGCSVCQGSGAKAGTQLETCSICSGSGRVHETRNSILGQFTTARACTTCEGIGKISKEKCSECKGQGVKRKQEEIKIQVPMGINNGEMIRMTGQGEAVKTGTSGDLYVKIHVKSHATFKRDGTNLIMDLPMKLTDALMGTIVSIETLEGKTLEVKIPPMKRAEELLRVAGNGIPNNGRRGDLIIRLEVALPNKLSNKARKVIEDLKSEGL